MRINICRRLKIRMPEPGLDLFQRHAAAQQKRCAGMTQIVKANLFDTGFFRKHFHAAGAAVGTNAVAIGVNTNEIALPRVVFRPVMHHVLKLSCARLLEQLHKRRRHGQCAGAGFGFCLFLYQFHFGFQLGIIIGNMGWIKEFCDAGVKVYGDYGLNVFNEQARLLFEEMGAELYLPSPETDVCDERGIALMITEHIIDSETLLDRKGREYKIETAESEDKTLIY